MSAPLRPPSRAWFKTRQRLTGLVFLVLLALLAGVSVAAYNHEFSSDTMVTLYTDSTGNEMNIGADVQVKGVVVGQVRSITADGSGARLELAINLATAASLPANVSAEMLPTTLFGERYVSIIEPSQSSGDAGAAAPLTQTLADTRVISQDRSADAVELEKVLNDMLPMLTAVQPQKLSVTLTAIAGALQNRGTTLGTTLDQVNRTLKQFNPQLPALDNDISELASVTQTYSQAAPGIISALRDFSVTSETVAAEQSNLQSLYDVVTGASQNLDTFLNQNQHNLISLSDNSNSTLQTLGRYSSEFPCVLNQLTKFIPNMDEALGAGTKQPGLRVSVTMLPGKSPYKPVVNAPRYGDDTGPACYSTPFQGIALNDGTSTITTAGLGLPNSPQENELVTELASPAVGAAPDTLPDWSSVLLGPIYRGEKVNVG
jgi:phospholipid/cholesterol/gamma-HCH transport system substrate-binding protein